ncbi:maleylpyruvate isomerase N-terminal domain-containing protein [Rhodococcoides yunnanense]|uniref:maleylpyruvate isomerase N-terminal domain-containing protein n=1 Tax=Rhodococcoides yunnanense TaxID=278209 RepID=UPI0009350CFF|nr:maleylpyruvate isomerase N-terminal domain-containing protein [Rhodococcus yunnanensis]
MSYADKSTTDNTQRTSRYWLVALQAASTDLRSLAGELSDEDLLQPSFVGAWTVAQVLSHLGSGAEICTDLVRRGLAGDERGPQRIELVPIWDRWNALSPSEQRDEWSRADSVHLDLLTSISADQEQSLRIPYFAGPMDLTTYLGYRLSEHSLHGWDVAVAYDSSATVGQLDLVWQRIDMIANRFHDHATREQLAPRRVSLHHDGQHDCLDIADEVHIGVNDDRAAHTAVTATTDILTRLVYGRVRPGDFLDITGPTTRDELTQLFPGF